MVGCDPSEGWAVFGGASLAFAAGAGVGISMTYQRHALASADAVRCGSKLVPRLRAWLLALIVYQVSNATLAVATMLAPLSLCTACFTLLLPWNIVSARRVMGEHPSRAQLFGVAAIVVGCVLSAAGVPADACNVFTVDEVARLTTSTPGRAFLSALGAATVAASSLSLWYERTIPRDSSPSPSVARLMTLVQPASLGLQEGLTQLSAKALFSMVFNDVAVSSDPLQRLKSHWVWLYASIVATLGIATIFWIKDIYARYETTTDLPIE